MARELRTEEAGAIHHVFARGNRSAEIFLDDRDRWRYLRLLTTTIDLHRWACLQYCLMTNHVHLLIETPEPNLAIGMRRLHGDYAAGFNRRHGYAGHVFQGRYGAVRIKDDAHLITVLRYLDRNPVDAGIVASPVDWPWCGAAAIRNGRGPEWLALDRLGSILPEKRIDLQDANVVLRGQTPLRVVEGSRELAARVKGSDPLEGG